MRLNKLFNPWQVIIFSLLLAFGIAQVEAQTPQSAQAPPNLPQLADPTVIGIQLRNPDSSREVLGAGIRYITDKDSLVLYAQFYNETGKELLTLFAGSTQHLKRSFTGYEFIRQDKPSLMARRHLRNLKHFATGKGIVLGLGEDRVKHILGDPTNETKNGDGSTTITYTFDDASSPFLQFFKATSYSSAYTFTHGSLTDAKVAFK